MSKTENNKAIGYGLMGAGIVVLALSTGEQSLVMYIAGIGMMLVGYMIK